MFIDNLINYEEEKRVISENSIIIPLLYGNDGKVKGAIQVSNNDK